MNRVILIGWLQSMKRISVNQEEIVEAIIETDERRRGARGELEERPESHFVLIRGALLESFTRDAQVGAYLCVEGSLRTQSDGARKWVAIEATHTIMYTKPDIKEATTTVNAEKQEVAPPQAPTKPAPPAKQQEPPGVAPTQSPKVAELPKADPKLQEALFKVSGLGSQPYSKPQKDAPSRLKELVVAGANVNDSFGQNRLTPLQLAARAAFPEVVKALIALGAKIDAQDADEKTALHWLFWVESADEDRVVKTLEHLLAAKPSLTLTNKEKATPLHVAVCWNLPRATALLLEAGAPLDVKDAQGRDALACACVHNQPEIVRLLLAKGASPSDALLQELKTSKQKALLDVLTPPKKKKGAASDAAQAFEPFFDALRKLQPKKKLKTTALSLEEIIKHLSAVAEALGYQMGFSEAEFGHVEEAAREFDDEEDGPSTESLETAADNLSDFGRESHDKTIEQMIAALPKEKQDEIDAHKTIETLLGEKVNKRDKQKPRERLLNSLGRLFSRAFVKGAREAGF